MAFSDDFTGPDGQLLSARTGWQLVGGEDVLVIDGNKPVKPNASTTPVSVYGTGEDEQTVQEATADVTSSIIFGLAIFATSSGPSNTVNCYFLRAQVGNGAVRVYQINNGVLGTLIVNATTDGDTNSITLRGSINGDGNVVITVLQNGVQIASGIDSSANKKVSGQRGIIVNATGGVTGGGVDNYSDNYTEASAGATITITERPNGFTWEGKRAASSISYAGAYTGEPVGIDARVVDENGDAVTGFDWDSVAFAAGSLTIDIAALPIGGPYRIQTRDTAAPETVFTSVNDFYVGTVVIGIGQSQLSRFRSAGAGLLSPDAGVRAHVLHAVDETGVSSQLATVSAITSSTGSGLVALANQWNADTDEPIMFVDLNLPGTGVDEWNDDNVEGGWNIWSGFATTVLTALNGQCTEAFMLWGTNMIGMNYATLLAELDEFMTNLASLVGFRPVLSIMPHPRSCEDPTLNGTNWRLRNTEYQIANSGPNFALLGWLLDWIMASDGDVHQADGALGNIRGGRRVGRLLAGRIDGDVPQFGPQAVSAQFTSTARDVIAIEYDQPLSTPSAATESLPLFYVSEDDWADASNLSYETGFTAAIASSNTVELTKDEGAWSAGARVDYCRTTPWDTEGGRYGGEAAVASLVDQMLAGTDSFDGGRGMPASPMMGDGIAVEAAMDGYTAISPETPVNLSVAEFATLRVPAGVAPGVYAPVTLRWAGGGIDVAVTVEA